MATAVTRVAARAKTFPAPIGTTYQDLTGFGNPMAITAVPGGGGTITLSYSTTKGAATLGAAAVWIAWGGGSPTTPTREFVQGPLTGLRIVAATGAGTVEVLG